MRKAMRLTAFLSSPVGTVLRYACSLAVLGWLALKVDWRNFQQLGGLDWTLAGPAALLAGIAYPLQAWRWQLLLRAQELTPSTRWTHGIFWIGQFYNSFLPGGVAGDAVRVYYLWRWQPTAKIPGAASVMADRVLGFAALLLLAVLALGFYLSGVSSQSAAGLQALFLASAGSLVVLVAGVWLIIRGRWWERWLARWLSVEKIIATRTAILGFGRHPAIMTGAVALSIAVWLVDFISVWLLARSVGLDAGWLSVTVAAAAAYVAAALPISIGGHGVREGALLGTFALLGVGAAQPETLAPLALSFWAVSVLWSLVGGAVYFAALVAGWPVSRETARISQP
ncbi:lysylphosphatidylglycerol synthase transmembrane domain-containing protein [Oleiharenicola lentus]|uniref:lysylphosphatidylglycerol synthase transmembrane domain-containing protein n=1 Tax=Oleiharenicola lentus TaxID=2508720 RepID=UPI003F66ED7B